MSKRPPFVAKIASLAVFALSIATTAVTAATHDTFFPSRPAGATLYTDSGILMDYGVGNISGQVVIKHADGTTVSFYVGTPFAIDGAGVRCSDYIFASPPPANAGSPNPWQYCSDWPQYITIGQTVVTVTYWVGTRYGSQVLITDQLDTHRTNPASKRRKAGHHS